MPLDSLVGRMGTRSILPVKCPLLLTQCQTFNGDFDRHSAGNLLLNKPLGFAQCNGSFTLPDMDSVTDSDSDLKPDGYSVLYRNHCTDSD